MSITEQTRREAYESVPLSAMEDKVFSVLLRHGPQISEEIMARLGTSNPNNVRPRLSGLKKKGMVRAVDKRPNRNGRSEAVWEAVEKKSRPGANDTEGGKGKDSTENIPGGGGNVNA